MSTRLNKNQTEVDLNGRIYPVRSTFDFLDTAGDSLDALKNFIDRARDGSIHTEGLAKHILKIYVGGIKAAGEKVDIDQLKNDIAAEGISSAALKLQDFYLIAHYGGQILEDLHKEDILEKKV